MSTPQPWPVQRAVRSPARSRPSPAAGCARIPRWPAWGDAFSPVCSVPLAATGLLRGRSASPMPPGPSVTPRRRWQKIPCEAPASFNPRMEQPRSDLLASLRSTPLLRALLILNVSF